MTIPPTRYRLAIHEAGHVVVALSQRERLKCITGTTLSVKRVWILTEEKYNELDPSVGLREENYGGAELSGVRFPCTLIRESLHSFPDDYERAIIYIRFKMGGMAAEAHHTNKRLGDIRTNHEDGDWAQGKNILGDLYSDDEAERVVESMCREVEKDILRPHWEETKAIAQALLDYNELSTAEITEVLQNNVPESKLLKK